jgi:hypothetical protein
MGKHHPLSYKRAKSLVTWLEYFCTGDNDIQWKRSWFKGFYYSDQFVYQESEFSYYVKNSPWVPTQKGYEKPDQVFFRSEEIMSIFGNHVSYNRYPMSEETASFIGIHTKATFEKVLNYLKTIASTDSHTVNLTVIKKIYRFMNNGG